MGRAFGSFGWLSIRCPPTTYHPLQGTPFQGIDLASEFSAPDSLAQADLSGVIRQGFPERHIGPVSPRAARPCGSRSGNGSPRAPRTSLCPENGRASAPDRPLPFMSDTIKDLSKRVRTAICFWNAFDTFKQVERKLGEGVMRPVQVKPRLIAIDARPINL
jgi:hypothetical protein